MKLSQFFNSKKHIYEQKEKLEKQEKELIEEAYKEGLFEISLSSFIKEYNKLQKNEILLIEDAEVKIYPYIPKQYSQNLSSAIDWIKNAQMNAYLEIKLQTKFDALSKNFMVPFDAEPKFSDGTGLLENADCKQVTLTGEKQLLIKNTSNSKLLINIHPNSPILSHLDRYLGQAILNVVKMKEKKAKLDKVFRKNNIEK